MKKIMKLIIVIIFILTFPLSSPAFILSGVFSGTTSTAIPSAPSGVSVTAQSSTTVTVGWTKSSGAINYDIK